MTQPPETIPDLEALDDLLSTPTSGVVDTLAGMDGTLLVLGAAGKMGPSLARMAKRAAPHLRVVAVSRFTNPDARAAFERHGIETLTADLLDPSQLAALPEARNLVYMAGMKFGATGNEPLTWAMNAFLPGMVCQRFPDARIAAFSTGNVYPLAPIVCGGSVESDPPNPVGEYAQSCLGRERIFEHFSRTQGTPVALLRLNYAVEMRYGVPVDIARRVLAGAPIPLAMGAANVIWQGDANAMALRSLALADSPATVWNLAGPETLSIRRIAQAFGERFGKAPHFEGDEAPTALLSNGQRLMARCGYPRVPVGRLLDWIADWVARGGADLGKPTHFEARDGRF